MNDPTTPTTQTAEQELREGISRLLATYVARNKPELVVPFTSHNAKVALAKTNEVLEVPIGEEAEGAR